MLCMQLVIVGLYWALTHAGNCGLANMSIFLESEECGGCISVNTTSCTGRCVTQDPVYKSLLGHHVQHICNFRDFTYETVRLPDCPDGVDPIFTYPVALSCECSQCNTDNTDCGTPNIEMSGCLAH